jgi:hypothetical protein
MFKEYYCKIIKKKGIFLYLLFLLLIILFIITPENLTCFNNFLHKIIIPNQLKGTLFVIYAKNRKCSFSR